MMQELNCSEQVSTLLDPFHDLLMQFLQPFLFVLHFDYVGRLLEEQVDTEAASDLQTLGMGYETFEEPDGADLPNDYLKSEAERILEDQDEKSFSEQSEAIQRQAKAMKVSAQLDSLLGPFSGVLRRL